MTEFINTLASGHWHTLVLFNIQNSLFLILVFAAARLLRRYPARYLKGLMLAGLAKLFIPPFLPLPATPDSTWRAGSDIIVSALERSAAVQSHSLSLPALLLLFWLAGMIIFLSLTLIRGGRIYSSLRRGHPYNAEPWEQRLLHPYRVRLLQATDNGGAMLTGIIKPVIMLPARWQKLSMAQRQIILTHEINHLRARDNIIVLLSTLARILYFFNPLVWMLGSRLHTYMEKSCDDATVKRLKLSPRDYSSEILAISEKNSSDTFVLAAALSFSRTHKNLKERMLYQLKRKERTMRKPLFFPTLITLMAAFALACSQGVSPIEERAVDFFDLTVKPRMIHKEAPRYPELARKAGIEGRVVTLVYIDETGTPVKAEVIKPVHEALDKAAVEAAMKVRFTPGEKNRRKVACKMSIPFDFRLNK